jgi:hypothetical protein
LSGKPDKAAPDNQGPVPKQFSRKASEGRANIIRIKPGVRASEYANYMSKIERELRAAGDDHVLLVGYRAD